MSIFTSVKSMFSFFTAMALVVLGLGVGFYDSISFLSKNGVLGLAGLQ
jgi:hypothetical protein